MMELGFPSLRIGRTRTKCYVIPGNPIPWKRPGGTTKRYDMQAAEKLEVGLQLRHQHGGHKLFEGPIYLDIEFHIAIPKSYKHPNQWIGKYVETKPDTSNLLKFYEDVGSGIIYQDDKQIVKITAIKIYNTEVKTVMKIQDILQDE